MLLMLRSSELRGGIPGSKPKTGRGYPAPTHHSAVDEWEVGSVVNYLFENSKKSLRDLASVLLHYC